MAMRYNDPTYGDVEIIADKYRNNDALAVSLVCCEDGAHLTTLSCNMPDSHLLPEGVFYAKTYSENEPLVPALKSSGWFDMLPGGCHSGFVFLPLWKLRATRR